MNNASDDFGLEFLLGFDGRVHHLDKGYWMKFVIRRVSTTDERPHGISYSLTLHEPSGQRLLGFDNAHPAPKRGKPGITQPAAHDHWHRTERDPGRPYEFIDAAKLVDDFFDEAERILSAHGVGTEVIEVEEPRK